MLLIPTCGPLGPFFKSWSAFRGYFPGFQGNTQAFLVSSFAPLVDDRTYRLVVDNGGGGLVWSLGHEVPSFPSPPVLTFSLIPLPAFFVWPLFFLLRNILQRFSLVDEGSLPLNLTSAETPFGLRFFVFQSGSFSNPPPHKPKNLYSLWFRPPFRVKASLLWRGGL